MDIKSDVFHRIPSFCGKFRRGWNRGIAPTAAPGKSHWNKMPKITSEPLGAEKNSPQESRFPPKGKTSRIHRFSPWSWGETHLTTGGLEHTMQGEPVLFPAAIIKRVPRPLASSASSVSAGGSFLFCKRARPCRSRRWPTAVLWHALPPREGHGFTGWMGKNPGKAVSLLYDGINRRSIAHLL